MATLTTVTSRIDMIAPRTTTMATASTPRSSPPDGPDASGGSSATSGDERVLTAVFQSSTPPTRAAVCRFQVTRSMMPGETDISELDYSAGRDQHAPGGRSMAELPLSGVTVVSVEHAVAAP